MTCPRPNKPCNEYMCGSMIDGVCMEGISMISREELVNAIDKDIHKWSFPYPLKLINLPNFNKLVEYENEIYNQALDDFMKLSKKNHYQVEGVDITPAFIKTLEFLVKEVKDINNQRKEHN